MGAREVEQTPYDPQQQPPQYPQYPAQPQYPTYAPGGSMPSPGMPSPGMPQGMPGGAPPAPVRPDKRKRNLIIGLVFLGVVALCCAVGVIAIAASPGGSSSPTASATDTPAPTVTEAPTEAPPTATSDTSALASAYAATVTSDGALISSDLNTMGNDCSNVDASNLYTCRQDIQTIATDAQAFTDDLNATPAPPCLKAADTALRKALADIQQGSQDAVNGIDDNSTAEINTGTTLYHKGVNELDNATAQAQAASC